MLADTTTSARSQAAEAIARDLDEQVRRVRLADVDWSIYATEGAIVSLHITRWRGRATLSLKDLGVLSESAREQEAWSKLLNLGSRLLLPRRILERLLSIENKARATVERCSYQTTWGRFIPRKRYAEWSAANTVLQAEYLQAIEEVGRQWPELMAEIEADYTVIGAANLQRLKRAGAVDQATDAMAWVRNFVQQTMAQIPSAEAFVQSARYEWDTAYVPVSKQVDYADKPALAAARDRLDAMQDMMEADLRRTASKKAAEDLGRFVADIQGDLRERIYNAVIDVLEAIKKNKTLPRNSTKQVKNLIEQVSSLKFWPDAELEQQLAQIAALVDIPSDRRPVAKVEEALRELGKESRLVLLELDRAPRRSGLEVGIVDDPLLPEKANRQVRAAKADLDDGRATLPLPITRRSAKPELMAI